MSMALTDASGACDDLGARLKVRKDAIARAADKAVRIAGRSAWPRMAGFAALGFLAGVAVLSGRKAAMQALTGAAGDWFAALRADHQLVDRLFEMLLKTEDHEGVKRQLIFSKIAYALAKHEFEEEHVIYPTLLEQGPPETPRHLDSEHFEMKRFVHELAGQPKDSNAWLAKARALHRLIKAHVREEEEIVFPRLKGGLTPKQNARLTRAMHREGVKLA